MGSIQGAGATLTGHEPVRTAVFRSAGFSPQGRSVGTLLRTEFRAPAGGRFMGSSQGAGATLTGHEPW